MVSNSDLRIQDDVEKTARGKWGNGCKWMRGKVESFLKIVVNGFWGPIGFGNGMVKAVAPIRITEAELARDVREGVEVIVEQDHRPIAIMRTPQPSGRPVSEILREAKERNSTVTLDSDFGADLGSIIAAHEQPWNPPSWE